MSQNLEDIARLAGVSRSTVSRVINNHPNVNVDTRARVLKIINERQFRPNVAARALVTQRTRVLSVVIPQLLAATFTDPYFPTLLQSITLRANQHDYALMLWVGNSTEEERRFCDRILSNTLFDGIIIASAVDGDPLVARLDETGFPYVLIGPPHRPDIHYVDVDNVRGAHDAVAYLINLGYRRIATITGPMNMPASRDRLAGYRVALEIAGCPIDESLIVEGTFYELSGYQAMKILLGRDADAVFVASDMMALGALRALNEAGIRIPQDFAVVSFDDMPFAAGTNPPLTTVRQPIADMGAWATDIMVKLLNDPPKAPQQLVLPARLIVRESCSLERG